MKTLRTAFDRARYNTKETEREAGFALAAAVVLGL